MRGTDARTGSLFSCGELEAWVSTGHPLRVTRSLVDEVLATIAGDLSALYADPARPLILPDKLLRVMLLQAVDFGGATAVRARYGLREGPLLRRLPSGAP